MNLLKLKYFHTVILEGSFTKAAASLKVAQPSISKMVKELEDEIGFALIVRSKKSLSLTPQGELVFSHASRIFEEVQTLEDNLFSPATVLTGPLKIGATDIIASELLPTTVASLLRKNVELYPFVQTGSVTGLCQAVLLRESEFALSFYVPDNLPDGLTVENLCSYKFRLVVATSKKDDLAVLQSFIGSREVDSERKKFPALDRLRKKYPKARIKLSTNSLISHLQYVRKGSGVAILPDFLVSKYLVSGSLTEVFPGASFTFALKKVTRKNVKLSLAAEEFLGSLVNNLMKRKSKHD